MGFNKWPERAEAKRLGLPRYFTGRPCVNGHIAERLTKAGDCVECVKSWPTRYPQDREKKRLSKKRWDQENAEYRRAYRALNYNHDRFVYATSRAGPACPKWADLEAIEAFYLACPPGMVVDHIVAFYALTSGGYPVSGLHVLWNLQYLTPIENMRKNRFITGGSNQAC